MVQKDLRREVRKLIREMWNMNPTWGRPRIHAELAKIGLTASQTSCIKQVLSHVTTDDPAQQTAMMTYDVYLSGMGQRVRARKARH